MTESNAGTTGTDLTSGTKPLDTEEQTPLGTKTPGALIRRSANLPESEWPDARISAVRAYAGKAAKTVAQLTVFLATAQRYGLDPIIGQLFLMDTEQGPKVGAGRDAWITLARRERGYRGMEFSAVHERDVFSWERLPDATILITHRVPGIARGKLVGAYALVKDERLGQNIEVRELANFNHLLSKFNWKNYPQDMIVNRCIAAVLRKQYSFPGLIISGEEDELLPDAQQQIGEARTVAATATRAEALRQSLGAAKPIAEIAPPPPVSVIPNAERVEALLAAQRDGAKLTDDELEDIRQYNIDLDEAAKAKHDTQTSE